MKNESGEEEFSFDHPENIQLPMIASTVDFFTGKGANPSPIEEAVTLMEIIDAFATVK